jgi:hypothetical protein
MGIWLGNGRLRKRDIKGAVHQPEWGKISDIGNQFKCGTITTELKSRLMAS